MPTVLYGADGRVIMREGRILTGDPGTCTDCCDEPLWYWKAVACPAGPGVCGCAATNFGPYVYIRSDDRCPGETAPPAEGRVVRAASSSYPGAAGCYTLLNGPGDTRYTPDQAEPEKRATIFQCIDGGCGDTLCASSAVFAEARRCDPTSNVRAFLCFDKLQATQQGGFYFCPDAASYGTFTDCPYNVIPGALVYNDWPTSQDILLSCCSAGEGPCSKTAIVGPAACPDGGLEYNVPEGTTCVWCCDPLHDVSTNLVSYTESMQDFEAGTGYTCSSSGPCSEFGTYTINCVDHLGQPFTRTGDCSSCGYPRGGEMPFGECNSDFCGQGGDRVEITGTTGVTGDTRYNHYQAEQYRCNGVLRIRFMRHEVIQWSRGKVGCQGGCGLKDACFPTPPGLLAGRARGGTAAPIGRVSAGALRGHRAMQRAQAIVGGLGRGTVVSLASIPRSPARAATSPPEPSAASPTPRPSGCAGCNRRPLGDLSELRRILGA